jgi:hypothetical protein
MNKSIKTAILNDERLARKLQAIINITRFDDMEANTLGKGVGGTCCVENVSINGEVFSLVDLINLFQEIGLYNKYNQPSYDNWYDQEEARLQAETA